MSDTIIPTQIFILILVIIICGVLSIIIIQWSKVRQSQNSLDLFKKEIELKKITMVEKDLESKRLIENPIPLPKEQQDNLSAIRSSTTDIRNEIGFLHNEISERLARLEAETEQKKLEKMLKEIEIKEKKLKKYNR